jgi:hypothetical protein
LLARRSTIRFNDSKQRSQHLRATSECEDIQKQRYSGCCTQKSLHMVMWPEIRQKELAKEVHCIAYQRCAQLHTDNRDGAHTAHLRLVLAQRAGGRSCSSIAYCAGSRVTAPRIMKTQRRFASACTDISKSSTANIVLSNHVVAASVVACENPTPQMNARMRPEQPTCSRTTMQM